MSTSLISFLLLKREVDYILFLKLLSLIFNSKMQKVVRVKPSTTRSSPNFLNSTLSRPPSHLMVANSGKRRFRLGFPTTNVRNQAGDTRKIYQPRKNPQNFPK